jgi:hypothetical protein
MAAVVPHELFDFQLSRRVNVLAGAKARDKLRASTSKATEIGRAHSGFLDKFIDLFEEASMSHNGDIVYPI